MVARVFKQKFDQLMNDLIAGKLLGKVVTHMHVREFQKRGLPHAHILIILAAGDRAFTPDLVDSIVVAELPPDPDDTEDDAEKKQLSDYRPLFYLTWFMVPVEEKSQAVPVWRTESVRRSFPKTCRRRL